MGRIIAIDYGKQRVGIAVTDPLKCIATPLTTVSNNDLWAFLQQYLAQEVVEAFVVGLPKRLDNTASDMTVVVEQFVKLLAKHFPKQRIFQQDERYTSKIAQMALIQGGFKKGVRRNKANLDKISATIILQSFLAKQSHPSVA